MYPSNTGIAANNATQACQASEVSDAERVVNHLRNNVQRAQICRETILTLRDKILGGRPCDPSVKGPQPVANVLLGIINQENESLDVVLGNMAEMLSELNRAL